MKKEYDVPQMDIVKFSMNMDIMTGSGETEPADTGSYGDMPGANSL